MSPPARAPALSWTPGQGGLLSPLSMAVVPTLVQVELPPDARPVRPLHLTLLRAASMAPLEAVLGPDWPAVQAGLPPMPAPRLAGVLRLAVRPPHPTKDPPDEKRPRRTWFLGATNQDELRAGLARVVAALDAASRDRGGPAFPHPEPDRYFHVSLYNDRGGDPRRSIGDIGPRDR